MIELAFEHGYSGVSLDAHPHLREYFERLRAQQPEAWRAAHRRLYEHLRATTPDKPDATLEDLQPLYQAMVHGCQAGLRKKVRTKRSLQYSFPRVIRPLNRRPRPGGTPGV